MHLNNTKSTSRAFDYIGMSSVHDAVECYRSSPEMSLYRGVCRASSDGLHHIHHEHSSVAYWSAVLTSVTKKKNIDLGWVDTLPPADASTLHCTYGCNLHPITPRLAVAEVLEENGRHSDAIRFVQADVQVSFYSLVLVCSSASLALFSVRVQFQHVGQSARGAGTWTMPRGARSTLARCRSV